MEIDYNCVRRVIINDKFLTKSILGLGPSRDDLDRLGLYVPDAVVIGFGRYGFLNLWYFDVESRLYFKDPHGQAPGNVNMTELLYKFRQRGGVIRPKVVKLKPINTPPDPFDRA